MTPEEILAALLAYQLELDGILSRFHHTENSISIEEQDNYRLRTFVTELIDLLKDHIPGSAQHIRLIAGSYDSGRSNMYARSSFASVREIGSIVAAVITRVQRNRALFIVTTNEASPSDNVQNLLVALDKTVNRFHAVVMQLRDRHSQRPTLDVNDEYDVQDLMHSLLRINFDDVRAEEWVPSYAGAASRTDFLLPQIETVVEIKKTRQGLNARAVGEQLIIDIAKYKRHPQCRLLVCFVYDPEGRIANPSGIENDLNSGDHGIEVRVSIVPKAT